MMDAVATIPPFETFYTEHASEVLGLLRRRLGRDRADDAFQETFLRALRAYDRLRHGEHLRAWVLTIATRVVIDAHRRAGEPRADRLGHRAGRRSGRHLPDAPVRQGDLDGHAHGASCTAGGATAGVRAAYAK